MNSEITIQVKHLTQNNYSVTIASDATVGELKESLQTKSSVPAKETKLIFKGKIFKDDKETLKDLKVENGAVLHMIHQKPVDQTPVAPPQPTP